MLNFSKKVIRHRAGAYIYVSYNNMSVCIITILNYNNDNYYCLCPNNDYKHAILHATNKQVFKLMIIDYLSHYMNNHVNIQTHNTLR